MVYISYLNLHLITDSSSERESIAQDDQRAYIGGVIRLRSGMNDDRTSQRLNCESYARLMRHCRAVVEISSIALVGKKIFFVVHESEQNGFVDIVLEGVSAATERIMDLTIMIACENITIRN